MESTTLDNKEYHVTDCAIGISKNTADNKSRFLMSVKPSSSGTIEKKSYTIDRTNAIKKIILDQI
jgi:hypothetical protein